MVKITLRPTGAAASDSHPPAAQQGGPASSSSTTTSAPAPSSSTTIRFKQSSSSSNNDAQNGQQQTPFPHQQRYPGQNPALQQANLANNLTPAPTSGKRKRSSLTPSGANDSGLGTPTGSGALKVQTRHATTAPAPVSPEKVYEDGLTLLSTLRDYRKDGRLLSTEFQHLPPRDLYPDYYQQIKRPLSYAEIRSKLERREYSSAGLKGVFDDLHQVFVNAKRYNAKGSGIWDDARRLDKLLKNTYDRLSGGAATSEQENGASTAHLPADVPSTPPQVPETTNRRASATPAVPLSGSTPNPGTPVSASGVNANTGGKNKKQKKGTPAVANDGKPITLTKWLSEKVDDLMSATDSTGRLLCTPFVHLPPREEFPDYYTLIARPVSFQLVRSRLKNRNYPTITHFLNDVNSIFSNAQFYNEEGSAIYNDSQTLQANFKEIMDREEPPEFFVRPQNRKDREGREIPNDRSMDLDGSPGTGDGTPGGHRASSANLVPDASFAAALAEKNAMDDFKFVDTFDEVAPSDTTQTSTAQTPASNHIQSTAGDGVKTETSDALPDAKRMEVDSAQNPQSVSQGAGLQVASGISAQFNDVFSSHAPQPQEQPPQFDMRPSSTFDDIHALLAKADTPPVTLSSPAPQDAPPENTAPPAAPAAVAPKAKPLAVSSLLQPPSFLSFVLTLYTSDPSPVMQLTLSNAVVKQHTMHLPLAVERVDLVIYTSSSPQQSFHAQDLDGPKVSMRPLHTVAEQPLAMDGAGQIQQKDATPLPKKWLIRPSRGLSTLEIETKEQERYRIWLVKSA